MIQAHPALFTKLATYSNPAKIPPALVAQAIAAAGGGAKGLGILTTISANKAAITGVIAVAPALQTVAPYAADLKTIAPYSTQLTTIAPYSAELTTMAPYAAQLTALSKVPPGVFAYLKAHGAAVTKAAAQTAGQWKTWYWICFGGIIVLPADHPAAARPVAAARRPAGRGRARGQGAGRTGQAQRSRLTPLTAPRYGRMPSMRATIPVCLRWLAPPTGRRARQMPGRVLAWSACPRAGLVRLGASARWA